MFGVQVEWSRELGGVPVLVTEPNLEWVARPDPAIRTWAGTIEILPTVVTRATVRPAMIGTSGTPALSRQPLRSRRSDHRGWLA